MITILLATYNGEKYIEEQLDSLFSQTWQDFYLYVQDDASQDNTWEILQAYQKRYPQRMEIHQNEKNSGNAKYNFMDMMIKKKDEYLMLCDQDDVWLPDKIEITFQKMKSMEEDYGKGTPLLVHTDLIVVDENLNEISPSLKTHIGTATIKNLKEMLIQNNVTGCTAMYNLALAKYIQKVPREFVMHDWWLALIAITFGVMGYIDEGTSFYRQHGKNLVGVQDVGSLEHKLYKVGNTKEIREALFASYRQALSFLTIYREELSEKDVRTLEIYSGLLEKNKIQRLYTLVHHGMLRKGAYRKLSQLLLG